MGFGGVRQISNCTQKKMKPFRKPYAKGERIFGQVEKKRRYNVYDNKLVSLIKSTSTHTFLRYHHH